MNHLIHALMYCISDAAVLVQEQKEFNVMLKQAGLIPLYRDEYKMLARNRAQLTTFLRLDERLDDGKVDRPFLDADEALENAAAYERASLYRAMNIAYQVAGDTAVDCSYFGRQVVLFRAANTAHRLMLTYNEIKNAEEDEELLLRMI